MEGGDPLEPYLREGRVVAIPRRRAARLSLLDLVAGRFEPGRRYPEAAVNAVLAEYHADYCALRRYLVEEEFLDRRDGQYWRVGGTVDVTEDEPANVEGWV